MLRVAATLINRGLRIYWRLRKPTTFGVRALVFGPDRRLLLVKHTYDRYWYLPGGARKRGEAAEAALRRELAEELGITDLVIDRSLAVYTSTFEGKRDTIDVFVAAAGALGHRQRLEIADARWFALDALPPDLSPATRRRVEEHAGRRAIDPTW